MLGNLHTITGLTNEILSLMRSKGEIGRKRGRRKEKGNVRLQS